jgi:hypothetical protein
MGADMISSVTLVHNQAMNLGRILSAYAAQSLVPKVFVFVLDRCTDDSYDMILRFSEKFNVKILETDHGSGFMAGFNRDVGLAYLKEAHPLTSVLFLDGDCVPTHDLFCVVNKTLECGEARVALISRKLETEAGAVIDDYRIVSPWSKNKIFVSGINNIVTSMYLARQRQLTWSGSLGLNMTAVDAVVDVVSRITGEARLFSSAFDGVWGGEDDFIGLVAMFYSINVCAVDPSNYVQHIYHTSKCDESFSDNGRVQYEKLRLLAIKDQAPGLYNAAIDIEKIYIDDMLKAVALLREGNIQQGEEIFQLNKQLQRT